MSICLSVLCLFVSVMFCFHDVIIDYCHMQSLPLVTNIHFGSKQRGNTQFFFFNLFWNLINQFSYL